MSRVGPALTLAATCRGCKHLRAERYDCQSDWGYDYFCQHPERDGKGLGVRVPCENTPEWCPELAAAKAAFLETVKP